MNSSYALKSFAYVLMPLALLRCAGGGPSNASPDANDFDFETGLDDSSRTLPFAVGGKVTGLSGKGLILQNNGKDEIIPNSDGSFAFNTWLTTGSPYQVTIKQRPTDPNQVCTVRSGQGIVQTQNVNDIRVDCVLDAFVVKGSTLGLVGKGLVLQNNATDDLSVTQEGTFAFASPLPSGSSYRVTIKTQPLDPKQTCSLSNDTGIMNIADVTHVKVQCATDTFKVKVSVKGLIGQGLVVRNNDGDELTLNNNGSFAFGIPIASNATYNVSVKSNPTGPSQNCFVKNGSGIIKSTDIEDVEVECFTNTFSVGGTVSGLQGGNLVLQNKGTDALTIIKNGPFTFATPVQSGNAYDVTIVNQSTSYIQTCTVTNGNGTLSSNNITNVLINCDPLSKIVISLDIPPDNRTISDGPLNGCFMDTPGLPLISTINIPEHYFSVRKVTVSLHNLKHSYAGDLGARLNHNSMDVWLFYRLGRKGGASSCGSGADFIEGLYSFNDNAALSIADYVTNIPTASIVPIGTYLPSQWEGARSLLNSFAFHSTLGNWQLFVADYTAGDIGTLDGWTLTLEP